MFWEEKIDLVKKRYPQPEFKDPFRDGGEIIEKIIRRFHHCTPLKFFQSTDRKSLINDCSALRQCSIRQFYNEELERLDADTNYWLFLIPDSRVYDCRKASLQYVLYLSSGQEKQEFYIACKKYLWAVYFILDNEKNHVEIYKSRNIKTIFD